MSTISYNFKTMLLLCSAIFILYLNHIYLSLYLIYRILGNNVFFCQISCTNIWTKCQRGQTEETQKRLALHLWTQTLCHECCTISTNDSMKTGKLEQHLKSKHPSSVGNDKEYLAIKRKDRQSDCLSLIIKTNKITERKAFQKCDTCEDVSMTFITIQCTLCNSQPIYLLFQSQHYIK